MDMKEYMTISEVGNILGISRQAVYISIQNKRLEAEKIGRQWFILPENMVKYKKNRYSRTLCRRENGELLFDNSKGQYSIHQLAKICKVSPQRVYYLARRNGLKSERIGAAYVIQVDDMEEIKKTIIGE